MQQTAPAAQAGGAMTASISLRQLAGLFKLRIGVVIAFTALAGVAVTPGAAPASWQVLVLALAVLVSSAAAGAFNQYYERDLDVLMERTRRRPFVTGSLQHHAGWVWLIGVMVAGATVAAALAVNVVSAIYVFLGAFFYGVVYTVWLKRRTWLNIVIGGLAGSFALLAGASAVAPGLTPEAILLAVVLFLWTPSHFWSLAIANRKDYAAARVPMLPVVIGDAACARIILANTVMLVAVSLAPALYSLGWIYFAGAAAGGAYFIKKNLDLVRDPNRKTAFGCFHASLLQLSVLLTAGILDAAFR